MYVVSAFRRTSRESPAKPDTTYYMEPKTALIHQFANYWNVYLKLNIITYTSLMKPVVWNVLLSSSVPLAPVTVCIR